MPQNIPVAILLGIFGSFCFAMSAHVQHRAVGEEIDDLHARQRLTGRKLLRLIQSPRWWAGLGFMGISAVVQIIALALAPVSVVQPVGLLAFPWSVLLAARAHGKALPRPMVTAVTATVFATLAFTVVAATHASGRSDLDIGRVIAAALVVYVAAAIMSTLGTRGPLDWRCLFWASGGALFYGLEAALVKSLIEFAQDHDWLRSPILWGIVAALILGSVMAGLLVQQGYATGPAEVVVGSMTVTSPVVAVLFGIIVLGEGRNLTIGWGALMLGLGLCAIAGVALMTRLHPHYDDPVAPEVS